MTVEIIQAIGLYILSPILLVAMVLVLFWFLNK
jgi:hypothetical protein